MIRVLWIDDQCNEPEMIQFVIEAENEGLQLEGYPSFEEGFQVLENNFERFDLILLDGLFFEKKGQEKGTEDETGIGMAIAKINELKSKKILPWFVLSGKDKFTAGDNVLLKANKAKCFDKTKPSDVERLFKEMKSAANELQETQLKHRYSLLLETCSDQFLGEDQFTRLFSLIKHIENVEKLANPEDMLTPLRKIIERMFRRMMEQGIIPEAILANTSKGWVNRSSLFLARKHEDYEYVSHIVPPLVSESFHRLLNITQDASHGDGELRLGVDHYLKSANSDYLYRSCVFLLFDLLLWFKDYMANNADKEANLKKWKSKEEWLIGTVLRIASNGFGTFISNEGKQLAILPSDVDAHSLKENDVIKVKTKPSSDGTKTHIDQIITEQ